MKTSWSFFIFLTLAFCDVHLLAHTSIARQITLEETTVVKEIDRYPDNSVSVAICSHVFDPFGFLEAARIFEKRFQVSVKNIYLMSETEEIYNLTSD